jgi:tRNA threonylcarbamoyladenosine biosynthesis protein TsaB
LRLLAVETGTDMCSVAVADGDSLFCRSDSTPRVHARRILGMVDECLTQANLDLSDVDALVFGRGPGSFTGLRIAVAVVQGLAFGVARPVIPVSSLAAHAAAVFRIHDQRRIAVCVDARMGECYWGAFQIGEAGVPDPVGDERLGAPAELPELEGDGWFGIGTGWCSYPDLRSRYDSVLIGKDTALLPEARDLLGIAGHDFRAGRVFPAEEALPVYLREQVAWRT